MAAIGTVIKKAFQGTGKLTNAVFPATAAIYTFNDSRDQGNGIVESVARAGFDYALGEALGMKMIPLTLAQAAPSVALSGYQAIDRMSRQTTMQNVNTPFINSQFTDSQQAYTMRQHGMQLAKNSRYHLEQSLMGNEAQHFKY